MRTFAPGLALAAALAFASAPGVSAAPAASGLQIDGYVQARMTSASDNTFVYNEDTTFDVPRARVRFQHASNLANIVLSLEGADTSNSIIRDAYIQVPFGGATRTNRPFTFWMGQFKVPFGYAVLESNEDREFPERPAGFGGANVLFPDVRDRGARLSYAQGALAADVAVVNGNGRSADANDAKDVYGRLGYDFGSFNVAASTRVGDSRVANVPVLNNLYGIGFQVPSLFAGKLTAEYAQGIAGRAQIKPETWYAQYIYPVTQRWDIGGRYTYLDLDKDAAGVAERGFGFVAVYEPAENLRFTGSMEFLKVGSDNATVGVLQTQYGF